MEVAALSSGSVQRECPAGSFGNRTSAGWIGQVRLSGGSIDVGRVDPVNMVSTVGGRIRVSL